MEILPVWRIEFLKAASVSVPPASDRLRKAALKILNKSTKQEAKSQWTSVLQLIKIHSVHFRMEKQVPESVSLCPH